MEVIKLGYGDSKRKRETRPAGHVPLEKIHGLSEGEMGLLKSCFISHGMSLGDGRFEVSIFCTIGQQRMRWHIFRGNGTEIAYWKYVFKGQPNDHILLEYVTGLTEGEKKFLASAGMSHGIKIPDDPNGHFEVSGYKLAGDKIAWVIYRGKGEDGSGWERVVNE